jgi:hypothetical protein
MLDEREDSYRVVFRHKNQFWYVVEQGQYRVIPAQSI